MPVQKHIIRKQTLEVIFEGATDAFVFKEQLSGFCTKKLLPAIEKVFDEKSKIGRRIKAGKLIIEVGELPEENWESLLCEEVVKQLLEALSSCSESFSGTAIEGKERRCLQTANVKEVSEQENAVNFLFYFLGTGLLPWNASVKNKEELQSLMAAALGQNTFLAQLAQRIKARPQVPERLVHQFKEPVLEKIIKAIGVDQNLIDQIKKLVFSLFDKIYFPAAERKGLLYQALLENAFSWQNKQASSKSTDIFEEEVLKAVFKKTPEEKLLHLAQLLGATSSKEEKRAKQIIEKLINGRQKEDKPKQPPESGKHKFTNGIIEQEYFIGNAGLVLLNPFMTALFENVGYTEKNKWLSEEVQERALALTQYLVADQEEYPEFDLLLNKILIGYPLDKTLAGDIELSEFEKEEAKDLLLSVIRHWAALKNTSVEGLQSTFLQREGKIWFRDSKSYLKVGQKTVDILMNKLPWGISIIKTPWMDHMMHVEWN